VYELKVDEIFYWTKNEILKFYRYYFFFNPNSNNKMFQKFDKHDILKNKVDNASSNKNHPIILSHLIYKYLNTKHSPLLSL